MTTAAQQARGVLAAPSSGSRRGRPRTARQTSAGAPASATALGGTLGVSRSQTRPSLPTRPAQPQASAREETRVHTVSTQVCGAMVTAPQTGTDRWPRSHAAGRARGSTPCRRVS